MHLWLLDIQKQNWTRSWQQKCGFHINRNDQNSSIGALNRKQWEVAGSILQKYIYRILTAKKPLWRKQALLFWLKRLCMGISTCEMQINTVKINQTQIDYLDCGNHAVRSSFQVASCSNRFLRKLSTMKRDFLTQKRKQLSSFRPSGSSWVECKGLTKSDLFHSFSSRSNLPVPKACVEGKFTSTLDLFVMITCKKIMDREVDSE